MSFASHNKHLLMNRYLLFLFLSLCGLVSTLSAQTWLNVTFENDVENTQLGVYDAWEESPFRLGQMTGEAGVVDNPLPAAQANLGYAPNESRRVARVVRSREGSNAFGLRIDLRQPFSLSGGTQYGHVLALTPCSSRMLVIGLGRNRNYPQIPADTEQFWAISTTETTAGQWTDLLFNICGSSDVDIYSLVIVPDASSPHDVEADFDCYIDNVVIDVCLFNRFSNNEYAVNTNSYQDQWLKTRHVNEIGLQDLADQQDKFLPVAQEQNRLVYQKMLSNTFYLTSGRPYRPVIAADNSRDLTGYVYLDRDNDGFFNGAIYEGDGLGDKSDLLSYASMAAYEMPTFVIPEDMPHGIYRMRFKTDYDCRDAGGRCTYGHNIQGEGGMIADVLVNVHGDEAWLECRQRDTNAVVLLDDSTMLSQAQLPFLHPVTLCVETSADYELAGLTVTHGYHLDGDSLVHGNQQWRTEWLTAKPGRTEITIPASMMDGFVRVEAVTSPKSASPQEPEPEPEQHPLSGMSLAVLGGSISVKPESEVCKNYWTEQLGLEIVNYGINGAGLSATTQVPGIREEAQDAALHHHDIYLLWASSNDFKTQSQMSDVTAGLDYCYKQILDHNPKAHVVLFTSMPVFNAGSSGYDVKATGEKSMRAYVDAEIAWCEANEVPYLDLFREAGFNTSNRTHYYYDDNVHLKTLGYEHIKQRTTAFLEECIRQIAAIEEVAVDATSETDIIYNILGQPMTSSRKGMVIIRRAGGQVQKYIQR